MKEIQIFCDFDGTITKVDTLNQFLKLYADKKWLEIEEKWENGEIGSRECMSEQMKLFSDMTEEKIDKFLSAVELDTYFPEFLKLIQQYNIDFYIVSDGFDLFINKILEKNGIQDIKVFANRLIFNKGSFISKYPYTDDQCSIKAGMCKCNIVKKYRNVTKSLIYIGDGLSDFCVSKKSDLLFAKERLLEYCKKNKNTNEHYNLIGFNNFSDIVFYLKENILNK